MNYRESAEKAIRMAKKELCEESDIFREVSVYEWLDRLNLVIYASNFYKLNLKKVSDLQFLDQAKQLGIKKLMDLKRIEGVM